MYYLVLFCGNTISEANDRDRDIIFAHLWNWNEMHIIFICSEKFTEWNSGAPENCLIFYLVLPWAA